MSQHKHCVFCGESNESSPVDSSICHSPLNPFPADTVGNKHHAFPVSNREKAKLAVARFAGKPVKLSAEFDKDWPWYCPSCGEGYNNPHCDLCGAESLNEDVQSS